MTELQRLFDAEPDDFATELLRSAQEDAPGARSFSQAARALGVSALLAGTAVAPSAAASTASLSGAALAGAHTAAGVSALSGTGAAVTFAVLAKHVAIGMVAGVLVTGGFYTAVGVPGAAAPRASETASARSTDQLPTRGAATRPSDAARSGRPQAEALEVSAGPVARFEDSNPVAEATVNARANARAVPPGSRATARNALASPVPAPEQAAPAAESEAAGKTAKKSLSLADEVALLDRARKGLQGGDALGSLSLLDEYRGVQRSNVLLPEAEVLRIQALERVGRTREAAALARIFVSQNPANRHAAALRALAERADATP